MKYLVFVLITIFLVVCAVKTFESLNVVLDIAQTHAETDRLNAEAAAYNAKANYEDSKTINTLVNNQTAIIWLLVFSFGSVLAFIAFLVTLKTLLNRRYQYAYNNQQYFENPYNQNQLGCGNDVVIYDERNNNNYQVQTYEVYTDEERWGSGY